MEQFATNFEEDLEVAQCCSRQEIQLSYLGWFIVVGWWLIVILMIRSLFEIKDLTWFGYVMFYVILLFCFSILFSVVAMFLLTHVCICVCVRVKLFVSNIVSCFALCLHPTWCLLIDLKTVSYLSTSSLVPSILFHPDHLIGEMVRTVSDTTNKET